MYSGRKLPERGSQIVSPFPSPGVAMPDTNSFFMNLPESGLHLG